MCLTRQLKTVAVPLITAMAVSSAVSCVNDAYDLRKEIDTTINIDGDISMPIGTSEFIKIGEFLKIEESDGIIKVDGDGNYILSFAGGEPVSASIEVPDIQLGTFDSKNVTIDLDKNGLFSKFAGMSTGSFPPFEFSYSLDPGTVNMLIDIDSELPSEIVDIKEIILDTRMHFAFGLSSGAVVLKKGLRIDFPEFLEIASNSSECSVSGGHTVVLERDVKISDSSHSLDLTLRKIAPSKAADGQGIITQNGKRKIYVQDNVNISGEINVSSSDFSVIPAELLLALNISVGSLNMISASVKIATEVNVAGQSIAIGELPEFISGENVVLDLYNPVIKFSADNRSPFTAVLDADIRAKKSGAVTSDIHIGDKGPADNSTDKIILNADSQRNIYISRYGSDEASANDLDIKVPAIGDLIKSIPEQIDIENINVEVYSEGYSTVTGAAAYGFAMEYAVYAPLAFGKDLKIEYDTDIKDLNGTFNNTEENSFAFEIAEADIKFNMYNSIPLKLALSATAIDLDGNPMDGVKASLNGEVMPSTLDSPALTPVHITLKADKDALKTFDGLRLLVSGTSDDSLEGQPLNSNQGIQLKNISLRIKGGVTTSLNE